MVHLDAADPAIKGGLEIDPVTWNGGRFDAQCDKVRDRGARRLGSPFGLTNDAASQERSLR